MKKSLLLIAAAAALFAACTDNDSFKDIKNQKGENNNAITFATGSEKVTKAENSNALYTWTFFEHQSDFKVWGYKILDPNVAVFGEDDNSGTKVTVKKEDNGSYTYSYDENGTKPLRFWDKISPNYRFFAAAPANGGWAFTYTGATADPAVYGTGTFATTSILTGVNLQSVENGGASVNLKNTFKGKADVDKMIAAPCLVEQVSYNKPNPDAVHLNFIHILSKLNVTIATDLSTSLYEIKLLDFEVMNMPGKGKFDESKAAADQTAQNSPRWDLTGNTYNDKIDYLTGYNTLTDGVAVNGTKKYILESLVIPQNINYERVALDGKHKDQTTIPATYYTSYAEYTQATPIEDPEVTASLFTDLYKDGENNTKVLRTYDEYKALDGKSETTQEQYNALLAKIIKTEEVDVAEYAKVENTENHSSEPYFMIKYSINGDVFTAYYNLVAAFNGLTNNETAFTGDKAGKDVLGFYEGWQNTLNIKIKPTAIEFTADVANWSDAEQATYEIEKGNY